MTRPTKRAGQGSPRRPGLESGLTLIELMISVLLSLFMASALLFVYLGLRTSFMAQTRMVQLQESQRIVQTSISSAIEQAGYYIDPLRQLIDAALPAGSISWTGRPDTAFAAGQFVSGVGDGNGTGALSDAISLRYQAGVRDNVFNCLGAGNTSLAPVVFVNTFSLNSNSELTCAVNNATPVVVASNIGRMQIWYGTDTLHPNTDSRLVDAYLPASVVEARALWNKVGSVRIQIFFTDNSNSPPVLLPVPVLMTIRLQNTL